VGRDKVTPFNWILNGKLATVLVVIVLIEAQRGIADDVLPRADGIVRVGADGFSGAAVDKADGVDEVVMLGLRAVEEVAGENNQADRLGLRELV